MSGIPEEPEERRCADCRMVGGAHSDTCADYPWIRMGEVREEARVELAGKDEEIAKLRAERDEAIRARDDWARQCNAASEAQADAVNRSSELATWARNRIAHCRREEAKFGAGSVAIEAALERRTLQAVLGILGARD